MNFTFYVNVHPGFLSGLSTAALPESFQRGMAPRIRPHVQSKYCSLDPYSPLTLVVPEGLSPPWKDCFVEGQRDVLHGGALSKALVQNAKLKQCSRYMTCVHVYITFVYYLTCICRGWMHTPSPSPPRETTQINDASP